MRTSQSADRCQAPWGPFSAKFKATANDLRQDRTQLRCYKDILLTDNYHKICYNKFIIKRVAKEQSNIQNET